MHKSELSEHDLVVQLKNPDTQNQAFTLLLERFSERIYWMARRMVIDHDDANDVTQNTFIKVWQNIQSYRGESSLYTWIYRIAVNESLSLLKKKRSLFFIPFYDIENKLSQGLGETDAFDGDESELRLQKAILKLPDKQRMVFNMKYFEKMTYEEMSAILKTSVGALKASFHLAVKKIENDISS